MLLYGTIYRAKIAKFAQIKYSFSYTETYNRRRKIIEMKVLEIILNMNTKNIVYKIIKK